MFITVRAGHATILSRQRDHVFRPHGCFLLHDKYIWCGNSISTPRPKYFSNFFVPEALLHCRIVIVAKL